MSISLRAYARHRKEVGLPGGTPRAVEVAIQSGRIPGDCLTKDGKIRSAKAADTAWLANTADDYRPLTGPTSSRGKPTGPVPADPGEAIDLNEARRRKEVANAALAELELGERQGELVAVREVEARLTNLFGSCRTKLLGIPARAAQRDPTLTRPQLTLLDALLREALEDLANGGAA